MLVVDVKAFPAGYVRNKSESAVNQRLRHWRYEASISLSEMPTSWKDFVNQKDEAPVVNSHVLHDALQAILSQNAPGHALPSQIANLHAIALIISEIRYIANVIFMYQSRSDRIRKRSSRALHRNPTNQSKAIPSTHVPHLLSSSFFPSSRLSHSLHIPTHNISTLSLTSSWPAQLFKFGMNALMCSLIEFHLRSVATTVSNRLFTRSSFCSVSDIFQKLEILTALLAKGNNFLTLVIFKEHFQIVFSDLFSRCAMHVRHTSFKRQQE
jgi:hypothetical protein